MVCPKKDKDKYVVSVTENRVKTSYVYSLPMTNENLDQAWRHRSEISTLGSLISSVVTVAQSFIKASLITIKSIFKTFFGELEDDVVVELNWLYGNGDSNGIVECFYNLYLKKNYNISYIGFFTENHVQRNIYLYDSNIMKNLGGLKMYYYDAELFYYRYNISPNNRHDYPYSKNYKSTKVVGDIAFDKREFNKYIEKQVLKYNKNKFDAGYNKGTYGYDESKLIYQKSFYV